MTNEKRTVDEKHYLEAIKGRREFRQMYRTQWEKNRALTECLTVLVECHDGFEKRLREAPSIAEAVEQHKEANKRAVEAWAKARELLGLPADGLEG